jgi:hypothetical protein
MRGIHVVMVDFRVFDLYTEARRPIGRVHATAKDLPFQEGVQLITWHFGRPSWEKQEVA